MKIYALLSWWDEDPDHLRRCVKSLRGFADVLVALDGAYRDFPGAKAQSPPEQSVALHDAVYETRMEYKITAPYKPWPSEVAKRAALFELGRGAGATPDDWFLIVDGDMALGAFDENARSVLAASDRNTAEVRWHDVQVDGKPASTYTFRSMFRALPGLTVERTHFIYTTAHGPCTICGCGIAEHAMGDAYYGTGEGMRRCDVGRRFLWLLPDGHPSPEPVLNLTDYVTLHHFNSSRSGERKRAALAYYADRDARRLETVGDWK